MNPRIAVPTLLALLVLPMAVPAASTDIPARLVLDEFETEPEGWSYIPGWEFPGAEGSLALDVGLAHSGTRSYRLQADLTAGAYVGAWRDLASLEGRDIREIRLWVRADNLSRIGVRINDSSGQCHQTHVGIPAASDDWQELVLKISDLVGGEHWGGANDGRWHGPATGFGLNIGTDAFPAGSAPRGSIHIDDVCAVPGSVVEGQPTLLSCTVDPPSCRPGFGSRITYRWEAVPMGRDFETSVHFVDADGRMVFQGDHVPSVPTSIWSGPIEYLRNVMVPIDIPDGTYRIILGLYDRRAATRGWDRPVLRTGDGVTAVPGETPATRYQVGVLTVDSTADLPRLPAPTLTLDGYTLTFQDEFDDLSVSATGPGTRWCTGTKENFGDARFVEPSEGFPFSIDRGILRIEAARRPGGWCAGILASADPGGNGFSQKFGYFEMRARFPESRGMWPAFWLLGQPSLTDKSQPNIEIDVVEHYGVSPHAIHSTMHVWHPDGTHWARANEVFDAPGLTDDFHTYGVMVEESHVTWYFDGIEIGKQQTPEEAKVPVYLLVNLAMGGGWPIDEAVSPSYMFVDYVRAYARTGP